MNSKLACFSVIVLAVLLRIAHAGPTPIYPRNAANISVQEFVERSASNELVFFSETNSIDLGRLGLGPRTGRFEVSLCLIGQRCLGAKREVKVVNINNDFVSNLSVINNKPSMVFCRFDSADTQCEVFQTSKGVLEHFAGYVHRFGLNRIAKTFSRLLSESSSRHCAESMFCNVRNNPSAINELVKRESLTTNEIIEMELLLYFAFRENDERVALRLIEKSVPSFGFSSRSHQLFVATDTSMPSVVKFLASTEKTIDINEQLENELTPLGIAYLNEVKEVQSILLALGACKLGNARKAYYVGYFPDTRMKTFADAVLITRRPKNLCSQALLATVAVSYLGAPNDFERFVAEHSKVWVDVANTEEFAELAARVLMSSDESAFQNLSRHIDRCVIVQAAIREVAFKLSDRVMSHAWSRNEAKNCRVLGQ
jgi:hypothetical protein